MGIDTLFKHLEMSRMHIKFLLNVQQVIGITLRNVLPLCDGKLQFIFRERAVKFDSCLTALTKFEFLPGLHLWLHLFLILRDLHQTNHKICFPCSMHSLRAGSLPLCMLPLCRNHWFSLSEKGAPAATTLENRQRALFVISKLKSSPEKLGVLKGNVGF